MRTGIRWSAKSVPKSVFQKWAKMSKPAPFCPTLRRCFAVTLSARSCPLFARSCPLLAAGARSLPAHPAAPLRVTEEPASGLAHRRSPGARIRMAGLRRSPRCCERPAPSGGRAGAPVCYFNFEPDVREHPNRTFLTVAAVQKRALPFGRWSRLPILETNIPGALK